MLNSTKLMNHLGGFDTCLRLFIVECCPRVTRGIITCGWPPRNKGTDVSPSEDAIRATKGQYGLCLDGVG